MPTHGRIEPPGPTHGLVVPKHQASRTPVKGKTIHAPQPVDIWETQCVAPGCGWGCTGDSPEAVVIALALHLDPEHVSYNPCVEAECVWGCTVYKDPPIPHQSYYGYVD